MNYINFFRLSIAVVADFAVFGFVEADFFDFFQMEWVTEFLAAHPRVRLDFVNPRPDEIAVLITGRRR